MTTTLRLVIDQPTPLADPDATHAARELAVALAQTAPSGCEVRGIAPADADREALAALPGVAGVDRLALRGATVAALWRRGMRAGVGDGLVHSASLAAPLVRHDRVHDHDQTVVTLWDLQGWDAPETLPRGAAAWARGMLRRAVRHADAVVVPTHHLARRLADLAPLGDRIRVIAGAPAAALRVPSDEVGRRRELSLPEGYVLMSAASASTADLVVAFHAVATAGRDTAVVVLDVAEGEEPMLADAASAAGIAEHRLHIRHRVDVPDRAAVYAGAVAFVAPQSSSRFPWRVLDALRLGLPVVASASETNRELLLDGATLVEPGESEALGHALSETLASTDSVERLSILAADRGRAFSWLGAAERTWQLHAEL